MKRIIKKIILKEKASSASYCAYLRKKGCNIGDGVEFFHLKDTNVDVTRPWLINIGDNVQITAGVTILTHGYDWAVLKGTTGEILGSSGKVTIGNNVFIGTHTTILKGVEIGNNVIIGANSLVNKSFGDNVVIAGNPAKVIMTVGEYHKKRKAVQVSEATELAIEYYKKYQKWPDDKILREFIFLYKERSSNIKNDPVFNEIGNLAGGGIDFCYEAFMGSEGVFNNYDDFIKYCRKKIHVSK